MKASDIGQVCNVHGTYVCVLFDMMTQDQNRRSQGDLWNQKGTIREYVHILDWAAFYSSGLDEKCLPLCKLLYPLTTVAPSGNRLEHPCLMLIEYKYPLLPWENLFLVAISGSHHNENQIIPWIVVTVMLPALDHFPIWRYLCRSVALRPPLTNERQDRKKSDITQK